MGGLMALFCIERSPRQHSWRGIVDGRGLPRPPTSYKKPSTHPAPPFPPTPTPTPTHRLADNVHSRGSVDESLDDWLVAITGSPLSVEPFLRRLKKKVVAVYKLDEAAVDAAIAPGLAAAAALR